MQLTDLLDQWQQQLAAGSTLPTVLVAAGLLVLLVPVFRRLVFDTLETIVATLLLLVLVVVVLGLPFAAAYIAFKGAAFTLRSLAASLSPLQNALTLTAQQVVQHT